MSQRCGCRGAVITETAGGTASKLKNAGREVNARIVNKYTTLRFVAREPTQIDCHDQSHGARAFAADAASLKAEFLKLEMPADFLARLNQLIAAFEQTTTEKATAVGAHVAAKISLDEAVARGLQAVRQLDVVIRNKFNGNPGILANWTRASHVAYRVRNTAPAPPPAPPDKPPTPNA